MLLGRALQKECQVWALTQSNSLWQPGVTDLGGD